MRVCAWRCSLIEYLSTCDSQMTHNNYLKWLSFCMLPEIVSEYYICASDSINYYCSDDTASERSERSDWGKRLRGYRRKGSGAWQSNDSPSQIRDCWWRQLLDRWERVAPCCWFQRKGCATWKGGIWRGTDHPSMPNRNSGYVWVQTSSELLNSPTIMLWDLPSGFKVRNLLVTFAEEQEDSSCESSDPHTKSHSRPHPSLEYIDRCR